MYLPYTYENKYTWNIHAIQSVDHKKHQHLVFIHGVSGSANSLFSTYDHFKDKYNCHYIDLPGFGLSHLVSGNVKDVKKFNIDQIIDHLCSAVIFYITNYIDENVILIGHSYGSYICTHLVCKYPDVINKAILTSCGGILPTMGKYAAYWALAYKIGIPQYVCKIFKLIENFHKWIQSTNVRIVNYENTNTYTDRFIAKIFNFDLQYTTMWERFTFIDLIKTNVPLAFIHGLNDQIIPYEHTENIAKIADVPLYSIIAGHMLNWTNSKEYCITIEIAIDNAKHPCHQINKIADRISYNELTTYKSSFNIKKCQSVNEKLANMLYEKKRRYWDI